MDRNPEPAITGAPISDDPDSVPVRVPVLCNLDTLPYYPDSQRWTFHLSGCADCNGEGTWPCEEGGPLALALEDALSYMRTTARCN